MTSRIAALTAIVGAMLAVMIAAWLLIAPASSSASLNQALKLLEKEQPEAAVEMLRKVVAQSPDDSQAALLLAQTALDLKPPLPEVALEQIQRLAKRDPTMPLKLQAIWRTVEGKAWTVRNHNAKAETALKQALEFDPKVAEAGWLLLQLYYRQGRQAESRELAMDLFDVEPNPMDRLALLLEPIRQESMPLAANGIIPLMKTAVANDPNDWRSRSALGIAQVGDGFADEGLATLSNEIQRSPSEETWIAYLRGLIEAGEINSFLDAFAKLPSHWRASPRMAVYKARFKQEKGDHDGAIAAYRQALNEEPDNLKLRYRFVRELRQAKRVEEANDQERLYDEQKAAREEQKAIYQSLSDKANGMTLSQLRRLAEIRELFGFKREALAWLAIATARESMESRP